MMSDESQRVVVIHHASSDLSTKALKWAINGFSLDHGDTLILVAILRHINSPTSARFRKFLKPSYFPSVYFIFVVSVIILRCIYIRKNLTII